MNDAFDSGCAISILMPSFNPGQYLREAVISALNQMSPLDELVVQDAGSDDGSQHILADLSAADPRVRVVVEPDTGQSDALNRALQRAVNPWVLWLNADDILENSALDALRRALLADSGVDLVAGGHRIRRADGSIVDTFAARALNVDSIVSRGCAAFSGSILLRTDYLRSLGGFENDLNTVMDMSLQLRIAAAQPRQVLVKAPIGSLRFHETSKSATLWFDFMRESHAVRMRYVHSSGLWLRAQNMTVLHILTRPIFRLRLTAGYRTWRRRVVQSFGR